MFLGALVHTLEDIRPFAEDVVHFVETIDMGGGGGGATKYADVKPSSDDRINPEYYTTQSSANH